MPISTKLFENNWILQHKKNQRKARNKGEFCSLLIFTNFYICSKIYLSHIKFCFFQITELKETTDGEISVADTKKINEVTSALITQIKEEPQDYDDIDMQMQNNNHDDDDDDDDDDEDDDDDDDDDEEQNVEIYDEDEINDNEDQDDDDDDDDEEVCLDNNVCSDEEMLINNDKKGLQSGKTSATDIQSDVSLKIFLFPFLIIRNLFILYFSLF